MAIALLVHRGDQEVEMRLKPGTEQSHGEKVVKDIRRATRKLYSAEQKVRFVLDGLNGEDSKSDLPPSTWFAKLFWQTKSVGPDHYVLIQYILLSHQRTHHSFCWICTW